MTMLFFGYEVLGSKEKFAEDLKERKLKEKREVCDNGLPHLRANARVQRNKLQETKEFGAHVFAGFCNDRIF